MGALGVGTANPAYPVDVNGTINCTELYIKGVKPGQYASSIVPRASAVPLITGTSANAVTLNLSAGEWFLSAEAWIAVASGSPNIQRITAALWNTSAALPTDPSDDCGVSMQEPQQPFLTGVILPIAGVYVNLTVTTTLYYLVVQATWTGTGTLVAYGKISGRVYPN